MDFNDITKATILDVAEIFNLYKLSIKAFEAKGIYQWNDEYPTREDLQDNVAAGSTWILKGDGEIRAAVTLDDQQDPQYGGIKWAYTTGKIMVIHRLVSHPAHQGKGLGRKMVFFSENFAFSNGYDVIRLDAFIGNPYSQNLYNHMNYHEAIGYCYYHRPAIMCNCFEKRIRL